MIRSLKLALTSFCIAALPSKFGSLSPIGQRAQSNFQLTQKKRLRIGGREAWNFNHRCKRDRLLQSKCILLGIFGRKGTGGSLNRRHCSHYKFFSLSRKRSTLEGLPVAPRGGFSCNHESRSSFCFTTLCFNCKLCFLS